MWSYAKNLNMHSLCVAHYMQLWHNYTCALYEAICIILCRVKTRTANYICWQGICTYIILTAEYIYQYLFWSLVCCVVMSIECYKRINRRTSTNVITMAYNITYYVWYIYYGCYYSHNHYAFVYISILLSYVDRNH